MSTEVKNMLGRFQKTGLKLFTETTKALAIPTVQYAIGAILILYITFLESETESVLSLAMTNPLGRLLVLIFLVLLVNVSVPLGILFTILIVMSCANRENFESLPSYNNTPPENALIENMIEEDNQEDKSFEEAFMEINGMSPELKVDEEGFQDVEPATGTSGIPETGELEGFSSKTTHSLF